MRLRAVFISVSLLASLVLVSVDRARAAESQVGIAVSVRVGPPALPVYEQPLCPGPGYIWQPGYWAYDDDEGYFWVPGTWVMPPEVGLLWTPGYWGYSEGVYLWHTGYWGPVVGFYGGIDYGYGYPGTGFYGGHWRGRDYYYNRNVTNVNTAVVRNVYHTTVINNNTTVNRVSFNGGPNGVHARPSAEQTRAMRERRVAMTSEQQQLQRSARNNRNLLAKVNHGRPDVAATPRPAQLNNRATAVPAKPVNSTAPVRNNDDPARRNEATPRAPERPGARPAPTPAPNAAPARPNERPPAHQPTPAPAPSHPNERPPAHQPQPHQPAPSHPADRPEHAPPPAKPAPTRPEPHQPAPTPRPQPQPKQQPAPKPSRPPAHTPQQHQSDDKPQHPHQ